MKCNGRATVIILFDTHTPHTARVQRMGFSKWSWSTTHMYWSGTVREDALSNSRWLGSFELCTFLQICCAENELFTVRTEQKKNRSNLRRHGQLMVWENPVFRDVMKRFVTCLCFFNVRRIDDAKINITSIEVWTVQPSHLYDRTFYAARMTCKMNHI